MNFGVDVDKFFDIAQTISNISGEPSNCIINNMRLGFDYLSPKIFVYMGIIINPLLAYTKYAEKTGKQIENLDGFEKRRAWFDEVLKQVEGFVSNAKGGEM